MDRHKLHHMYRAVVVLIGSSLLLLVGCGRTETFTPETAPMAAPVNQAVPETATPLPTLIFEVPNIKQTEIAQREQDELETALAGTPAPPKILPTDEPTVWPPPTPVWINTTPLAGGGQVFETDHYLEMRGFFSNNAWSYILSDNEVIVVHAGKAIESLDPAYQPASIQGGVYLGHSHIVGSPRNIFENFYPTPTRSGAARLVDALVSGNDIWVQVTTTGGATFVFHVTTRTWEATSALPTRTPSPAALPPGSPTLETPAASTQ